jgi:hypothetical protein
VIIIEIEAPYKNLWLCILLFAVKKKDKEPVRFHRTLDILSKQTTKIKCKIWK